MSRRIADSDFAQVIDGPHADGRRVEIAEREHVEVDPHTPREGKMAQKIAYWGATGLVTIVPLSAAFAYLTTAPQAVENFQHVGYPQQLRVLLGVAKLAGAIVLLLPRLPMLKEWAYAGFTFMWIAASVAHYLAGDKPLFLLPVALIGALSVSYVTRSAERRVSAEAMLS
jgi:DoxX-like family